MEATLIEDHVRWGREWAADPENADRVRRLSAAVEEARTEYHLWGLGLEDAVRYILEVVNQDANGAGTWVAQALEIDGDNVDEVDAIGRSEALEFWAFHFPADDPDFTDAVMYGVNEDGVGYGDGPLVGFVAGVLQHVRR